MDGIIIVNKEKDKTSRDVVNYLNDFFEMTKIGHAGTLDPLATGVLVVALGKCTKLIEILTGEDKEYIATMQLGLKTDTYDITGNIISKASAKFTQSEVEIAINSFQGEYEQEVPIYSAVKVNGRRLYEYARKNIPVELPKRSVNIKSIEVLTIKEEIVTFKTLVSKGTYIRSLINDIGNKLGCGATMIELERTKQGNYFLEQASTLNEIANDNYEFISLEKYLKNFPTEEINETNSKLIKNGGIIAKTFTSKYLVYCEGNKPIAIYQEYIKDKTKAKPFLMI